MERDIMASLELWKKSAHRKPLIMRGLRQVGKTWVLKEFGARHYTDVAYFNFDEQTDLSKLFESTKDVTRLIDNLAMLHGKPIVPGKTLLIFDEIQESNAALNSLKYFQENAPQQHLTCAGSLLGITLSKPASFPVGKVQFLTLRPMSFQEFLKANGDRNLAEYLQQIDRIEALPEIFFNPLLERLKTYFVTGGMPEPVRSWAEERDVGLVQEALKGLLDAYSLDFSKHAPVKDIPKLDMLWTSIPSQLSRENKKFLYGAVKSGARAREYEDALTWLSEAGLIHKVSRCSKPGLPLSAYEDLSAFKLYAADVGILRRLSQLDPSAFGDGTRLFTEFRGALTENFVLQGLTRLYDATPHYWSSGGQAEVDFLIQKGNEIIPVEVKSDINVRSRSLMLYGEKYSAVTRFKLRFSLRNLRKDGDILNIPLFMIDEVDRLLSMQHDVELETD
ncbi:MAG: AAA family ATPase [Rectinemataceae bacterium]